MVGEAGGDVDSPPLSTGRSSGGVVVVAVGEWAVVCRPLDDADALADSGLEEGGRVGVVVGGGGDAGVAEDRGMREGDGERVEPWRGKAAVGTRSGMSCMALLLIWVPSKRSPMIVGTGGGGEGGSTVTATDVAVRTAAVPAPMAAPRGYSLIRSMSARSGGGRTKRSRHRSRHALIARMAW